MKKWSKAEIEELTIKATYNDTLVVGYDGPIQGQNGETLSGMGHPHPDASGNVGTGTLYTDNVNQP